MAWKEKASGRIVTINSSDMKKILWMRAAKDFGLKVLCKNGNVVKFDGFSHSVRFSKIKKLVNLIISNRMRRTLMSSIEEQRPVMTCLSNQRK